jgi:hypothetical protein
MSLKDELTIIISKERFEDFISPFLSSMDPDEIVLSSRPREGDLVYFPLGKRIFEVKFVEHEQPFYQLGRTYVYELKCELFEYEDEVGGWDENVSETTQEIDTVLEEQGYITAIQLFGNGQTAEATAQLSSGYIRRVILNNDGYDYKQAPVVAISSAPIGGTNASAVAITTERGGIYSIKEILLVNAGAGYTTPPSISIISAHGGVGAAATCEIVTNYYGVKSANLTIAGQAYSIPPEIGISSATFGPMISSVLVPTVGVNGNISQILISDAGVGYTSIPTITVANPPLLSGIGTYRSNEVVTGTISGTKARVKTWTESSKILKVGIKDGSFVAGEIIVGSASSARYSVKSYSSDSLSDKYQGNDEIQIAADQIIDFSESSPFGNL